MKRHWKVSISGIAVVLVAAILGAWAPGTVAEKTTPAKYTFRSILWSTADPNIGWITKAAEDYVKLNPYVKIVSTGPERYDPTEHVTFLEMAIAAKPDGIYLHISDPVALKPALMKAKALGIPVVTHTGRFPEDILTPDLWLSNVGWDELEMGSAPAKHLLEKYGKPKHVAAIMGHVGHVGQEIRCKGFQRELPPDVKFTKVPVGDDPAKGYEILISFFKANADVDVAFNTTALSTPWVIRACEELGIADKIIQIGTCDSPTHLEAVILGKVNFTNGIQFYLNGWFPPEVLYLYNEKGLKPDRYIQQSIVIIDKTNAEAAKKMVIDTIGREAYDAMNPWK